MYKSKAKDAMQPLFAATISAITPKNIEIELYDDRIENIPYDKAVDLVGISIDTFGAKRSYEIAREFRKRNIKVIAGGFHPTILPEETLEYVDSVVIGDAEYSWHNVIKDLKKGELKRLYKPKKNADNIEIKFDRKIFANKSYGPVEMVQWGRGCPHNCDFCSIKAFYNSKQLYRSIESVVNELKSLKKKTVFFVDDNLYHNREKLVKFLKAITPLKIKWMCQISINVAKDKQLLFLMKKSGCFLVLIGIESFEGNNLKQMKKHWNTSGLSIEKAIKKINDFGIMIYGTFIFGYDFDTTGSFKQAVDFAIKNKFFIANFNPLYPMPGTELYKRLRIQKRLTFNKWWLDPEFYYGKSMFHPKTLSPVELELYCFNAKKEFNSWKSIFLRIIKLVISQKSIKYLVLYIYANTISRREIYKKQGKYLST